MGISHDMTDPHQIQFHYKYPLKFPLSVKFIQSCLVEVFFSATEIADLMLTYIKMILIPYTMRYTHLNLTQR